MIVLYVFLPESPSWCATRANKEAAGKKNLLKLYRGVEGYDVDKQWEVLAVTVQHEEEVARENKSIAWYNIFRGTNGVGSSILVVGSKTNCSSSEL